jgi:hypothetical protein
VTVQKASGPATVPLRLLVFVAAQHALLSLSSSSLSS